MAIRHGNLRKLPAHARWVALWRPLDILPFARLERHQQHALLERLARIRVDFEFDVRE